MSNKPIVINCFAHIAPYIETEVKAWGMPVQGSTLTTVQTTGTVQQAFELAYTLRCANRVLYQLDTFSCNSVDDLYKHTHAYDWDSLFDVDGYFSVTSYVSHPSIDNTMFANVRVKDAIVDFFNKKYGRRPNSGANMDKLVIYLYWKGDTATLYLDIGGDTLAKHGYRKNPFIAPMLESLAAAVVMATRWDSKTMHLINPMCGSGTLAIEAALMATGKVPGFLRDNYSVMHTKLYDHAWLAAVKRRILPEIRREIPFKIIASDINLRALDAARENAADAGIEFLIDFVKCDFAETPIPDGPGVVLLNPPYGERMSEADQLPELYKRIGDFFKQKCPGKKGFIFTGNMDAAKSVGLKADKRHLFYNAQIECRLLEFTLFEGSRKIKPATDI